jgi:hypothetical protein
MCSQDFISKRTAWSGILLTSGKRRYLQRSSKPPGSAIAKLRINFQIMVSSLSGADFARSFFPVAFDAFEFAIGNFELSVLRTVC